MENDIKSIAEKELEEIKDFNERIKSLRKNAVSLYLNGKSNQSISDYILYLMGDGPYEGKYYIYRREKMQSEKSEHMGVDTGYYLEEMIFDILSELILKKYGKKFEVARQINVVGTKNKKQDIVIKINNKPVIVLEIKTFMGDDNCEKMLKDRKQIEKKQIYYFGYAPYLYNDDQPKSIKAKKDGWLFYGKIEPLLSKVFTLLNRYQVSV